MKRAAKKKTWTSPKITILAVGMEINAYASASR
jgi:coenzyme PQQ precursor peptide PqqA